MARRKVRTYHGDVTVTDEAAKIADHVVGWATGSHGVPAAEAEKFLRDELGITFDADVEQLRVDGEEVSL